MPSTGVLVADYEEPTGPNHPVSGTAVVTSNVWHHAAVTYDATTGTWKLYLDGVLDRTLVLVERLPAQREQPPARRPRLLADDAPARRRRLLQRRARRGTHLEHRPQRCPDRGQLRQDPDRGQRASSPATASTRAPARRPPRASPAHPTARSPMARCGPPARRSRRVATARRSSAPTSPTRPTPRATPSASTPTRPMPISTR